MISKIFHLHAIVVSVWFLVHFWSPHNNDDNNNNNDSKHFGVNGSEWYKMNPFGVCGWHIKFKILMSPHADHFTYAYHHHHSLTARAVYNGVNHSRVHCVCVCVLRFIQLCTTRDVNESWWWWGGSVCRVTSLLLTTTRCLSVLQHGLENVRCVCSWRQWMKMLRLTREGFVLLLQCWVRETLFLITTCLCICPWPTLEDHVSWMWRGVHQ